MEDSRQKSEIWRESENVDKSIEQAPLKEEEQEQDVGVGTILSTPSHITSTKGTNNPSYNPSLKKLDNRINEKVKSQSSKMHCNDGQMASLDDRISAKANGPMHASSKTGNKVEHNISAVPKGASKGTSRLEISKSRVNAATSATPSPSYPRSTTFLQRSILNPYAILGKHVFDKTKARNKTNHKKKREIASVKVAEPDAAALQDLDHQKKPSGRTALQSVILQSQRIQHHLENNGPSDIFSANSVIAQDLGARPGAYNESGTRLNSNRGSYTITNMPPEDIPLEETTDGFQAYVVPTICDASNVQAIKSDKELEKVEKRRCMKKLMILSCLVFVLVVAIAFPVSLAAEGKEIIPIMTEEPSASPHNAPSSMPTSAPSTFRFSEAFDFLVDNNISNSEALSDTESPQGKAITWVSNEDIFRVEIGSKQFMQRYILAVFYYAMDGSNWETCIGEKGSCRVVSWLSPVHECSWSGSICSGGSLREINFAFSSDGYGLKGAFPEELCLLDEISVISLENNFIQGTIPSCFGKLSRLSILSLENNDLTGPIPQSLLSLPNLQVLTLAMNHLTGIFPSFDGTGNPQLARLDLSGNSIQGELPASLFGISGLKSVNISGNSITGSLPSNVGHNFNSSDVNGNKLEILDAGNNKLVGEIPGSLYNATGMKKLILSSNNFAGQLGPNIFISLPNLTELILDNNFFSGPVPETLVTPSQLNVLTLHGNNFNGSISKRICAAKDRERNELYRLKMLTLDCDGVACSCCDRETNCF